MAIENVLAKVMTIYCDVHQTTDYRCHARVGGLLFWDSCILDSRFRGNDGIPARLTMQ
jgi:hypothetical protein